MIRAGRLAILFAVLPLAALAEDKVDVQVQVVQASKKEGAVDPALASVKNGLAKLDYKSMKLVSSNRLTVTRAPSEVKLPNGGAATVKLVEMKEGSARLSVRTPASKAETVVSLGREGNIYQGAGSHQGDDVWLVLSPPSAKPRRSCGVARPLAHAATPLQTTSAQ